MRTLPFFALLAALLLVSCSEFSKAVKSTDVRYKYRMAVKYFEKPDYDRAMPLFEELLSLTRGDTLYEPVSYYYAKGYFGMKDYLMASYYLGNFSKTFRNSAHAEECDFLAAYCHYKESPEFELDQRDTHTAIDKLELFMVRYPESTLKDSCITLIDELRLKLEKKDYAAARQYLRLRNYQPASEALQGFLRRWPNSTFREEALLSVLQADHDLAVNSVEAKKAERIEAGIRSFNTFADAFPNSTRMAVAKAMLRDLTAEQKKLTSTTQP
ncbi:MAG TPA: outer membrane protein assembly factor BamD [Flavobacteriales bacterium]|nr:outer membrane protein assembly factor BamD [Flavobacteriales bacterium]HRO39801.1 outer membrane protein assembly factor BamD [Flavobacteriales bacterium]HRP80585.1 outer membrane protein assembly factor BamD [Flavobacteriales bacterium]HRQ86384.1 outer membrane protein assembly factor BamD [Flavobacteriales bacterium]